MEIFQHADQLTQIKPLHLRFRKGETQLTENDREIIRQWSRQIIEYDIPVFIYSFASAPTGIRNLSPDVARHEAIRVAVNRGLLAKKLLEQIGIQKKRLILKANGPDRSQFEDRITITTWRE